MPANQTLFSSTIIYNNMNYSNIDTAKHLFKDYQKEGIIKPQSNFEDIEWQTTDEYSNIGFHFNYNEFTYQKHYQKQLNLSLSEFIDYVKTHILTQFNLFTLSTLREFLLDTRRISEYSIDDICANKYNINVYTPSICQEFFSLLPNAEENDNMIALCNAMDMYCVNLAKNSPSAKRSLASFDSYFLFNDIITDYWESDLSEEERLFYFPLYFWWTLTSTIALRPREFLLIQRDCISKLPNGHSELRLRRNKIKGRRRSVSHKIDEDYFIEPIDIPEKLAMEIEKYIELTNQYSNTELNTLFITDVHYKKWGISKPHRSRYFTYANLRTLLRYFYNEIIVGKYNMKEIGKGSNLSTHLAENEIEVIQLGDTRHIALINLMFEGGTPAIAMALAGHTNAETASHYYMNIHNLIECFTYKQYRQITGGHVEYAISHYNKSLKNREGIKLTNGGYCYSTAYANHDFSDCEKCISNDGKIGHCPSCNEYRDDHISYFSNDDIYNRTIQSNCQTLVTAIEQYRTNKGDLTSIGEALLNLSSSSKSYAAYLKEKHTKEDL